MEQFLREGGIDFGDELDYTIINMSDSGIQEEDEDSQFQRLMLSTEGSFFIEGELIKSGIMCKSNMDIMSQQQKMNK